MPKIPRTSIDCPHCQHPLRVRSSRITSATSKQMNMQCTNLECGHTCAATLDILYTIAPSARPNPAVHLRIAPPRRKAANDNPGGSEVPLPIAANDDEGVGEAVATGG